MLVTLLFYNKEEHWLLIVLWCYIKNDFNES